MQCFFDEVIVNPEDALNPMLNLVAANYPACFPPRSLRQALILWMSEGEKLAEKMKAAGIKVHHQHYPKATHEFCGMANAVAAASAAQSLAARGLKSALRKVQKNCPASAPLAQIRDFS